MDACSRQVEQGGVHSNRIAIGGSRETSQYCYGCTGTQTKMERTLQSE